MTDLNSFQLIIDVSVYAFLFVLGLFVGSFLNVVADRTAKNQSFVKGRSKCDSCENLLSPRDLFPLISFYFLKGRCRYCNNSLSLSYPLSESLTGFAFVIVGVLTSISNVTNAYSYLNFAYLLLIVSIFIVIILADAKYTIIPNGAIYMGVIVSVLYYFAYHAYKLVKVYTALNANDFGKYLIQVGYFNDQIKDSVTSIGSVFLVAFVISVFFLFLILLTKGRGMGGGDLKLGFLIGLVNGYPYAFLAIFLGFVYGALYSIVLIILGRKSMKDTIPFGPFLVLGSITTLLFGVALVKLYLNIKL